MSVDKFFQLQSEKSVLQVRPMCHGGAFAEEASRAVWPELLEQLDEEHADVVVDMGSLTFFGSTMLDFIATMNKRARKLDGRVVLANLSDAGQEVLEIAKFDQFLDTFPTVDEAVAALEQ